MDEAKGRNEKTGGTQTERTCAAYAGESQAHVKYNPANEAEKDPNAPARLLISSGNRNNERAHAKTVLLVGDLKKTTAEHLEDGLSRGRENMTNGPPCIRDLQKSLKKKVSPGSHSSSPRSVKSKNPMKQDINCSWPT